MKVNELFTAALNPAALFEAAGMEADSWQVQVLNSRHRQILLNCSRQSGKSTVCAVLAIHTALFKPRSLTLVISKSQRQSIELFRKIKDIYGAISRPFSTDIENLTTMELGNGSRIVALPGKEATVRSYSKVDLILIDEASRVPDDLYYAVRPMLAVSRGRIVALSTPFGQRGFFHREWSSSSDYQRIIVTWQDCPRITEDFIDLERRSMGQEWIDQEYLCLFTHMTGLVYPDFGSTHIITWTPGPRWVGGIDWGFRAPFAAVWGVHDRDDVLWIQGERYERQTALHKHSEALPAGVAWWADPSGATEIAELRAQGHFIRRPYKMLRIGIQAVNARINTGRLKVNRLRCPNLCAEATLYRYLDEREEPLDENNHAMDALRYLICGVDRKFIGKLRKTGGYTPQNAEEPRSAVHSALWDEDIWTRVS